MEEEELEGGRMWEKKEGGEWKQEEDEKVEDKDEEDGIGRRQGDEGGHPIRPDGRCPPLPHLCSALAAPEFWVSSELPARD